MTPHHEWNSADVAKETQRRIDADAARQAQNLEPLSEDDFDGKMQRCQAWQILCIIGLGWTLATAAITVLVMG
ncbi:hypothetical protein FIU97_14750 [Roseivivax sp. THAF40]|uniref:hypothetical protein n=1 Tax=Roseivivax sp. THAF40 TaxID=2587858 RepID=UPI001267D51A|nr:hypothetical protein [Roseivivax sp. THAF40]QFT47839.1 hypothetical protein FIU97_14750 [Roseivivax sp. THAF40]